MLSLSSRSSQPALLTLMETLKRTLFDENSSHAVNEDNVQAKRMKKDDDEIENDDDFALARLRCLGMDVNEKSDSVVDDKEEKSPRSKKAHLSSQEEKELRRERGELLLRLFREVPWLADSASARRAEKNQERAQMWDKITNKVNESFGDRLEYLSVDKVKKLLTYYKKKDDGSYDNIKHSSMMDEMMEQTPEDIAAFLLPKSDPDAAETTDSSDDVTPPDEEEDGVKGVALIEEAPEGSQTLLDFLAAINTVSTFTTKPLESTSASISPAQTAAESIYQLKKDRHDFVVSQAEHYMERMCFDNSSRSAAVNAERHNMWIKITHKANEKFAEVLGPLGVEQAKKLYSNCKRRRRVKAENGKESSDSNNLHSRESYSIEPEDGDGNTEEGSNQDAPATNFEELIRGLDRTVEIDELKKQLRDKNEEIERLKKKVVQQANDYSSRIKAIIELLKVAVDKKISDDIKTLLS